MVLGEKHGTNYLPYTFSIPLSIVDLRKTSKYMCREEKFMLYITLLFAFRVQWGWTYTAGTVAD